MTTQLDKRFLTGGGTTPSATEVAKTLYKTPTLLTTWTRCGKVNCQCNAGHLHGPDHALYWRDGAEQRRRYVPARYLSAVQAILEERRDQRRLERQIHAHSLRMWRQLRHLAQDVEAQVRGERKNQ